MSCDFDRVIDRTISDCEKWHRYAPDVLAMWVADMDFQAPQPVIEALQKHVAHGIFGYGIEPPALRELIVQRLERLYHWHVAPEAIVFMPGVVIGFNHVCRTLAVPGEGVLVQTPVYPPILSAPGQQGLVRREMELTRGRDGRYCIDMDAFEHAASEARVFLLCNPHNPVGRVWTQFELEAMADVCLRHNLFICSDEIHCDLVYRGHDHRPFATLAPEIARRTVTLMAPSKTFNIAGLKCSFAIVEDPDLRQRLAGAQMGTMEPPNILGYAAAQAAYAQGQEWLDELLAYLEGNRDFLYRYVTDMLPDIEMGLPEGTFLAWLDCRAAGLPGSPANFFVDRARVGMNDGATFGRGGEGFVRFNFGCPRSLLAESLERMRRALIEG